MASKTLPKRKDLRTRTVTTFKKTYGSRVYHFTHEVTSLEGFRSASTFVRVKQKGDGPLAVGKLVHALLWFDDAETKGDTG